MNQIRINYDYEVLLFLIRKEAHGRELAKELKTSLKRIQTILNEFKKMNIVDFKVVGKNHIYFIKKNLLSKKIVLNAENYKLGKILTKYPLLESIFQDLIKKSRCRIIILFGSYAKGIPKEDSDIDIYLETRDNKIKKECEKIYPLINIKIGNFNPNEILIKEIIKNHVIIKGGEEYYERLGIFE